MLKRLGMSTRRVILGATKSGAKLKTVLQLGHTAIVFSMLILLAGIAVWQVLQSKFMMRLMLSLLLWFIILPFAGAQEALTAYIFTRADVSLTVSLPAGWEVREEGDTLTAQSAPYGTNVQTFTARIAAPDQLVYGDLPAGDQAGTLLEVLAAGLPITSEATSPQISEVERFTWGAYPAAALVADLPDVYREWVVIEFAPDQLITLIWSAIQPAGEVRQWADWRGVTVNATELPAATPTAVINRLLGTLYIENSGTASLRVRSGTEIRLSAPEGWYRQDVTRQAVYPTQYFFEDDPRTIPEGRFPPGAVIQVSIVDASRVTERLGTLPAPGQIAAAYATYLAQTPEEPGTAYQWGSYPAYRVDLTYPTSFAMHASGTHQQLILVEVGQDIVQLTIYAPESRWSTLEEVWQNILSGLLINGAGVE